MKAPVSKRRFDKLIRLLMEQRRALVVAESGENILKEYSALINFLRSATASELRRIFPGAEPTPPTVRQEINQTEAEISNLSRADVEKLINDEATLRKDLERIAIFRFRVPRGSMRSFSNREMLVNKLSALLSNEQAHTAIETVARGQAELPGIRSEGKT